MKLKMGDSENKKIETLSNYIIGKIFIFVPEI